MTIDTVLEKGRTLVVGATGILGREVARLLCEARRSVRAIVRASSDSGKVDALRRYPIELATADLKDPASLRIACEGMTTVISTANSMLSRAEGDNVSSVDEVGQLSLVSAARAAGVQRFVFVSFPPVTLDYQYQRAKRSVELELTNSGMQSALIQPAPFMEIWLSPALGFDSFNGKIRIFGNGDTPVSWVSVHDVARLAVVASSDSECVKQTILIGGPDPLSQIRASEIFHELGAPEPTFEKIPEAALEGMLQHASNPIEEAMAASMLVVARGMEFDPLQTQRLLPGRFTSVRDYASRLFGNSAGS